MNHDGLIEVDVVNLRLIATDSSNHGLSRRIEPGKGAEAARIGEREMDFGGEVKLPVPVYLRSNLGKGDSFKGASVIEEPGGTVVILPEGLCHLDEWGNSRIHLPSREFPSSSGSGEMGRGLGMSNLDIIEGAIIAAETEMESLDGRMSGSDMMRDLGDFRAALFDPAGRKLTGRTVSALVEPVLNNWKHEEIREGDVFVWNDPYLSDGGIGNLLNLCVYTPVFHHKDLVAFFIASGRHDDMAGMIYGGFVPASTEIYQEGFLVPPVRLYECGVVNDAAFQIITRNNRVPDRMRADIVAEVTAYRLGGAKVVALCEHFGKDVLLKSFGDLIEKCEKAVREELLPKIPDGEYSWEDYIESDGVEKYKTYVVKLWMKKAGGRLTLDFKGTSSQAKGPINWPGDYADGKFLKRRLGALLQNLAGSYKRMLGLDINEGVCALIDVHFPAQGSLLTPVFPALTNLQEITLLRLRSLFCGVLGLATKGRMPADQEACRIWGVGGRDREGTPFHFREMLGGGAGGRPWADGKDVLQFLPGA